MNKAFSKIIILVFSLPLVFNCSPTDDVKQNIVTPEKNKILTGAILFKVAAGIQDTYFRFGNLDKDNEFVKFFGIINHLASGKTENAKNKIDDGLKDEKLCKCILKIQACDQSVWTIKNILSKYNIPDMVKIGSNVCFNPFIFLPDFNGELIEEKNLNLLWDWFYSAILLNDNNLLDRVAPVFFKLLEESPEDLKIFNNLFQMSKHKYPGNKFDSTSAAYFYLLTANIDTFLQLTDGDSKKVQDIKNKYDSDYFKQQHITVNTFTLENRLYMWLAARDAEMKGDINKAYVYIKTTFDNQVLFDVEEFPPNNQVYLYTTVRLALNIRSPMMYRYVLGALDPLTKFNKTGNKDFLKTQLYQLID